MEEYVNIGKKVPKADAYDFPAQLFSHRLNALGETTGGNLKILRSNLSRLIRIEVPKFRCCGRQNKRATDHAGESVTGIERIEKINPIRKVIEWP